MDNQRIIAELTAIRDQVDSLLRDVTAHQFRPLPSYRNGGEATGTCLQGYVTASYADLLAVLGEPAAESDGYKVSTEWTVTHIATNSCVTLYDYKETSLYDEDLPSVELFRASPSHDWHIGATSKLAAAAFRRELLDAIAARQP